MGKYGIAAAVRTGAGREKNPYGLGIIIKEMNREIAEYGKQQGICLGTTVVVFLITQIRYFALNVGDSRLYELTDTALRQLTTDHTFGGQGNGDGTDDTGGCTKG